jgi:SAM-dependent methyltransferase
MSKHATQLAANRRAWDQWTPLHVRSPFYDLPAFERGGQALRPMQLAAIGPVAGKSLLHLQCHFGLETLSWARLGARVTGLDFSEAACAEARALAIRVGLQAHARFVAADLYDAAAALGGETFDLVFSSHGSLEWLPQLDPWADVVAACLRPGGRFHLFELHPVVWMFNDAVGEIIYPYDGGPIVFNQQGSYADRSAPLVTRTYNWNHGLGAVVTALLRAGLTLEKLEEHPWSSSSHLFPGMIETAPGQFQLPHHRDKIPLTYSLTARAVASR